MTPHETDDDRLTTAERWRAWRKAHPDVTNERWLASRIVWCVFLALSAWVGVRQIQLDNDFTREKIDRALEQDAALCATTNDRREEAQLVAEGDVSADQAALDSDMATWQAIDELFPDGIPEPARTTVFTGLAARQVAIDNQKELIEITYRQEPCPNEDGEFAGDTLPPDE